ncbi:MAG: hypothetical protein IKI30_02365, partial [Oxalobacter sp.]|nr:hypothetical protein [Oxalobacter sp.]
VRHHTLEPRIDRMRGFCFLQCLAYTQPNPPLPFYAACLCSPSLILFDIRIFNISDALQEKTALLIIAIM